MRLLHSCFLVVTLTVIAGTASAATTVTFDRASLDLTVGEVTIVTATVSPASEVDNVSFSATGAAAQFQEISTAADKAAGRRRLSITAVSTGQATLVAGDGLPDPGAGGGGRSVVSDTEALLTVENQTDVALQLIWLDFEGGEVFYQNIGANGFVSQASYVTHPWRLRRQDNGQIVMEIPALTGDTSVQVTEVAGNSLGSVAITVTDGTTTPPIAVAATSTSVIAVGGTAQLDGSGSHDTDEGGASIQEWIWSFENFNAPGTSFNVVQTSPTLQQVLAAPGEYLVTLTVKDNEGQLSAGTSSDAHITIKVVAVTFEPDPVIVAVDAIEPVTVRIVPQSAAALVSFDANAQIATIDKQTAQVSPETIHVTGKQQGNTRLEARVATNAGSESCGFVGITVVGGFIARVSGPNPHTLVSDGSGVISIGDMSLPNSSAP